MCRVAALRRLTQFRPRLLQPHQGAAPPHACSPTRRRRLSAADAARSRRMGDAVNRRLAGLAARATWERAAAAARVDAAIAAAAAEGGDAADAARRLSLGTIGQQTLAGRTEDDGVAYDLDNVLLWRALPGVLPLNSYMYLDQASDGEGSGGHKCLRTRGEEDIHACTRLDQQSRHHCAHPRSLAAQIKDLLKVSGPALLKTFASLVVRNDTCNATISVNGTAPPHHHYPTGDAGMDTPETAAQRAFEGAFPDSVLRGAGGNITTHGPCGRAVPARLLASLGSPFTCAAQCGGCDACNAGCLSCRVGAYGGGNVVIGANSGGGACAGACACGTACAACTDCRWAYPSAGRRRRLRDESAQSDGGGAGDEHDADAHARAARLERLAARHPRGGTRTGGGRARRLNTGSSVLTITFTCVPAPYDGDGDYCDIGEPTCQATTLPGGVDIETRNAVIHKIGERAARRCVICAMRRSITLHSPLRLCCHLRRPSSHRRPRAAAAARADGALPAGHLPRVRRRPAHAAAAACVSVRARRRPRRAAVDAGGGLPGVTSG